LDSSSARVRRIALRLAYRGDAFEGWQRQRRPSSHDPNEETPSVQRAVERALSNLFDTPIRIQGAGRTDSGVHAIGQTAHADVPLSGPPARALAALLDPRLPDSVIAWNVVDVPPLFDARRSARSRHYSYRLAWSTRRERPRWPISPIIGWWPARCDADKLAQAAAMLPGHRDWTLFRSKHCQAKDPVRDLTSVRVAPWSRDQRDALGLLPHHEGATVHIAAPAFLMHQVRFMMGAVARIASEDLTTDELALLLQAQRPDGFHPKLAPACGLTLDWVEYGPEFPQLAADHDTPTVVRSDKKPG